MSRRQMSGSVQCWRSQSRRICGELLCGLAGGGSSATAKLNVSPFFFFGIAGFLGVLGNAAIENKLILRCVAQVYRYDHALGIGAGLLVVEAGGGAELTSGIYPMARTCT